METFKSILLILFGGLIGYFANRAANKMTEDRIIKSFTDQITALKNQLQTGRATGDAQGQIQGLEMALELLKNK